WDGFSNDPDQTKDTTSIEVWGVRTDGISQHLTTVYNARDTSVSFIDADVYPFLKLKLNTEDKTFGTPYQLDFWRVRGTYIPEGAVAPNIYFNMPDTLEQGQPLEFAL